LINRKIMKYALWGAASGLLFAGEANAKIIKHCSVNIQNYEYRVYRDTGNKSPNSSGVMHRVEQAELQREFKSAGSQRGGSRRGINARKNAKKRFVECLTEWAKGNKSIGSISQCDNQRISGGGTDANDFQNYANRLSGNTLKDGAAGSICKENTYSGEGRVYTYIKYSGCGSGEHFVNMGTNYEYCSTYGSGEFKIDTDNDGIPDAFDFDDDNDGVSDNDDSHPKDPNLGGELTEAQQAEVNRKIIRCYADAAEKAYSPDSIGSGTRICSTSSKRDERLGQSDWVFLDHPDDIEYESDKCICADIYCPPCDTFDVLLKAYKRENAESVELLFAFQGTSLHNVIIHEDAMRRRQDLRSTEHNDFRLNVSGSHKDRMGIRNLKVHGYVHFLWEVWPFISEHVTAKRGTLGSKKLIIRTTGHSAGGALSEMTALVLANKYRDDNKVWVEGFSFNPVASVVKDHQGSFEDDMGRCHYQQHAFHASDDGVVRLVTAQHPSLNYIDKGGYWNSDFEINYSDSSKPESACGYTPHYTRSGGEHSMEHWVTTSIGQISDADAVSLFSKSIPGEAVSASSASAIAPF